MQNVSKKKEKTQRQLNKVIMKMAVSPKGSHEVEWRWVLSLNKERVGWFFEISHSRKIKGWRYFLTISVFWGYRAQTILSISHTRRNISENRGW